MARIKRFDSNTEALLKELDKTFRSVRSKAYVFKRENPQFLKHAQNPLREIVHYDTRSNKLSFDFNLKEVRKQLQSVDPSARESVLQAKIHFYRGKTQSKFSRYSEMKGQFGDEAHSKVSSFFDDLDEEQAKKIHEHFKDYNYEDEYSLVDFIDQYYAGVDDIDTAIEKLG